MGTNARITRRIATAAVATFAASTAATTATAATAADLPSRFASPMSSALPFNRYWVPGGAADPASLRSDIQDMAAHGIGGAEYNTLVLGDRYDVAKLGFGTPAWTENAKAALRAGRDFGVQLDLLLTPSWPTGSPLVTPDTAGSAKTLVKGDATVAGGATFDDTLPAPAAALPAGVTKRELVAVVAVRCSASCTPGDGPIQLDRSTATDLTAEVQNGRITWTAPSGGTWKLFAFSYQGNGQRPFGVPASSPAPWVIDHFSAVGTQAVTRLWDEQVLDPEMRRLVREGGGSIFVDSLELQDQNWTPGLENAFRSRQGRSLVPGLPVLSVEDEPEYEYAGGVGERYRAEWKATLTDLFVEHHLELLRTWSNRLGLKLRYQTYSSDGVSPIDPIEAFAHVDIPEGEDHVFNGTSGTTAAPAGADSFRATAAAAALSGKGIVSDECCATIEQFQNDSYRVTWQQMLRRINQNLSTGVNLVVYHGFSNRNASYHLQTFFPASWPGWNPFVPLTGIAEPWDSRQPTWEDQADINRYLGRMQTVLREGTLRSDIAIYHEGTRLGAPLFGDQGLARAGYTYGFLDDSLLEGDAATVRDGRLAPDGPAYGALVLNDQESLSLGTARRILADARAGLRVVVVGDAPSHSSNEGDGDADLRAVVAQLLADPHVVQVETEAAVPGALRDAGVRPAAEPGSPSPLVTVRRQAGDRELYYLYNSATTATDATVALAGDGEPYAMDAWSGRTTRIARHTRSGGRVDVRVTLPAGGSTVVALSRTPLDGAAAGRPAVRSTTADDVVSRDGGLAVRAAKPGTYETTLDDGRTVRTAIDRAPGTIALPTWQLAVQSWGPGETFDRDRKTPLPPVSVQAGADGRLPAWTALPGLADVSGVGTYTTTVDLPAGWSGGHGAHLDLGEVFDTFRVRVNGRDVPPVDQMSPNGIDVGPYLRAGTNTIEVREATTLRNSILANAPTQAGGTGSGRQDYGLRGPVTLRPYGEAPIDLPTAPVGDGPGTPGPTTPVPPSPPAPPSGPGADRVLPRLTRTALSPNRVRAGRPVRLSTSLSERATVRTQLLRRMTGRRRGERCLTGAQAPRAGARCTTWVVVRRTTTAAGPGRRTLTVVTAAQSRRLAAGVYRVVVTATDRAGNRSRRLTRSLRVTRR